MPHALSDLLAMNNEVEGKVCRFQSTKRRDGCPGPTANQILKFRSKLWPNGLLAGILIVFFFLFDSIKCAFRYRRLCSTTLRTYSNSFRRAWETCDCVKLSSHNSVGPAGSGHAHARRLSVHQSRHPTSLLSGVAKR